MHITAAARRLLPAVAPLRLLAMELRRRKLGPATPPAAKLASPQGCSAPIKRRGLSSAAAGGPRPGAGASTAADSAAEAAASRDVPAVPNPEATSGEGSNTAKRKRGRLPPVDIGAPGTRRPLASRSGMTNRPLASRSDVTNHSSWLFAGIPGLLLGQGAQVADVAAAADAVDALPLGQAGFTPETLAAARDFLLKADPSESWRDCQRGRGLLLGREVVRVALRDCMGALGQFTPLRRLHRAGANDCGARSAGPAAQKDRPKFPHAGQSNRVPGKCLPPGETAQPAPAINLWFSREMLIMAAPHLLRSPPPALTLSCARPHSSTLPQQLATTAAAKIYGRVLTTCGCSELLTPEAVLAAPMADLRAAGLSERKASYLHDLAQHFSDGRLSDARIAGAGCGAVHWCSAAAWGHGGAAGVVGRGLASAAAPSRASMSHPTSPAAPSEHSYGRGHSRACSVRCEGHW